MTSKLATPDLTRLLDSWRLQLQAEHKSPRTIRHYIGNSQTFLRWCETEGIAPELTKDTVQRFITDQLRWRESGTAKARYAALRSFSAWLTEQGEVPTDIFRDMTPPRTDAKVTNPLTDAELKDLVKVCKGNTFRCRRDEAIIRLMAETGMRAGEVCSLSTDDVDLMQGCAVVRRGKGAKGRVVSFGPQTAAALDRYDRMRCGHKLAARQEFWLGERANPLTYSGLFRIIRYRAELAGIKGCHPHQLRNTAAVRWLAAGGSETGLMSQAGWSNRDMITRYTQAAAAKLAGDEARRLRLGDL